MPKVNRNPDLAIGCNGLKAVIPRVLDDIINITMEIHGKQMAGTDAFLPLTCASERGKFELLWKEGS